MNVRRLIAQISDLHVKPAGQLAYGRIDTAAALTRCVNELNRLVPRPDIVVITGDLVDMPSPDAYDHLIELLAPLELPYAVSAGNHDDRALMRAAWPEHDRANGNGPLNSIYALSDVDVVLIDSTVPGRNYGTVDAQTLRWLDDTLTTSPMRPALLFLHHPPFLTGIGHMDAQNLRNADDLASILHKHPRVRLIAAGHVHRAVLTTFAGVAATICPAPSHAVALDLDGREPPSFKVEPPAFHLHIWSAGESFGSVVTHLIPIGVFDGPHPFFDRRGRLL